MKISIRNVVILVRSKGEVDLDTCGIFSARLPAHGYLKYSYSDFTFRISKRGTIWIHLRNNIGYWLEKQMFNELLNTILDFIQPYCTKKLKKFKIHVTNIQAVAKCTKEGINIQNTARHRMSKHLRINDILVDENFPYIHEYKTSLCTLKIYRHCLSFVAHSVKHFFQIVKAVKKLDSVG